MRFSHGGDRSPLCLENAMVRGRVSWRHDTPRTGPGQQPSCPCGILAGPRFLTAQVLWREGASAPLSIEAIGTPLR